MPVTLDLPPQPPQSTPRKPPPAPYLSKTPWWGFSAHDIPRAEPLGHCPSPRCVRAGTCRAAIDNLYCLRTHHSLPEQKWLLARHPLAKRLAQVPKVKDRRDLAAIARRAAELLRVRKEFNDEMTARWKAGELDHLYGPWKAHGVVMVPPGKRWIVSDPSR